ncbi:MAG: glycerol kinase GlpK, partial [Candidatus Omnitrophota bacterium]
MKYILAIDQGTTGSRAVIYDKKGRKITASYQEFPQYFPKPGWVEHNPQEIWKSVYDSIQKVLKKIPEAEIEAIGITNQRETTVIWDRNTGKPLYNAIVWQCRRTADRCDKLKRNKKEASLIRKITGLPIDAYFSATKIEWILKNVSGLAVKSKKIQICFGTTDSWILWNLTGGKVHATDYTNASRTMLFNIDTLKWDKRLLRKFNIPKEILPQVKKSSGFFGKTVKLGKLAQGIPVTGIAGDQQAALAGQACFNKGNVKNTYGTGSFILLNAGNKRPVLQQGLITTLGCGASGAPIYVIEGAVFVSGAAIQWLRDGLKILSSAGESQKMSEMLPDNEGVYFVPALVGLGAPYWDQMARGTIVGITRGTTRNHFARAALEAMCYQTKDVLIAIEKDSGIKMKSLKIDGGAVINNFLCQFQADILGCKVVRPKETETTSLGAAYLAGLATGYWKDAEEIKKHWQEDKVFVPKMSKKVSTHFYKGWLEAVKRT